MLTFKSNFVVLFCGIINLAVSGCQKATTAPSISGVADFTIVNAIPNNAEVLPVINTSQPIVWFANVRSIFYGQFNQNSVFPGADTIYAVQYDDTLEVGPKALGEMFYGILPLKNGGIYSLFLCGADTTSPDYLFTTDTISHYPPTDSVVGIRFVNLSTGSDPISINLEGNLNGSEVESLPYKGITSFKPYVNNSSTPDYFFVIRDAATGDSLTEYDFNLLGSVNNGNGLPDPINNNLLTFKSITIALIGQPGVNASVPQSAILIDNY